MRILASANSRCEGLHTYGLHLRINQSFQFVLHAQAQWKHVKNSRICLAEKARSDQEIISVFYIIVRKVDNNERERDQGYIRRTLFCLGSLFFNTAGWKAEIRRSGATIMLESGQQIA